MSPPILNQKLLRTYLPEENLIDKPDFFFMSVTNTIKSMPNSKVRGPSKLPIKLLNFWIVPINYTLSNYFELIWKQHHTSKNRNLSLIFPLYKNKGSKEDLLNYRPNALTEHIRKLFEKIIFKYI